MLLDPRAQALGLSASFFFFESSSLLLSGSSRRLALRLFCEGLSKQLLHAVQCAVAVGQLASLTLRGDPQNTGAVDAAPQPVANDRLSLLRQRQSIKVQLDGHASLELVHVLATRAAASRGSGAQQLRRDDHAVAQIEVSHPRR